MPRTPRSDLEAREWEARAVTATGGVTAETVHIVSGVRAPAEVVASGPVATVPPAEARSERGTSPQLWIRATYSRERAMYQVRELRVTAADDEDVTGTVLRDIAPQRLLRWILPRMFEVDEETMSYGVLLFIAPDLEEVVQLRESLQRSGRTPRPDMLRDAATIYQLAEAVHEPPLRAVAETLGMTTRTASRWIASARELGLMERSDSPRAASTVQPEPPAGLDALLAQIDREERERLLKLGLSAEAVEQAVAERHATVEAVVRRAQRQA